ncbi:peptidase S8 and S53 subtilisin kexin sedolisin [Chloroherpeton thalassium ATCC 35110]|uniref:Peptidase S8 and S53 subtilisin kexin sedolisin n=1 Tax=Chloroherpeton thalassium (strain ATCC 35110 / GB-78) TaxID=517418 RepID=B3QVF5_CHLT3|nr:S8 family serine peptidase [Chloroherpeton thalassium]ACF14555.1 peptidase S8 and S53 subtilisin kexin sedolisin [Chloroherpeton thalassium ATCC 35110]
MNHQKNFRWLTFLLFFSFSTQIVFSKPNADNWSFISKQTCGIDAFLDAHPNADGRGVIIVILDTGIDLGAPGLQKTSLGTRKVIDVQDFSGGGDVRLRKPIVVKTDSGIVVQDSSKMVSAVGVEKFGLSVDTDSLLFGYFDEQQFQNSDFNDFDGDNRSRSRFVILAFKTDSGYVALIDANGNHRLDDETPIRSYKRNFDTFTFSQKISGKRPPITCALNLFPEKQLVVLHFDDSSHGTHVAGIAAGHNIFSTNGEDTYDGVAPGAELVSCKISKGAIGDLTTTGSIKAGFDYAAKLSESQAKPVVVNMSFGVPSVIEGNSDIEKYIDKLILNHPNLFVCLSNGNEGPGLSTTGLPAASFRAISVGALLNVDIAQSSFGSLQQKNRMWNFSSRGGEVPKPDIVAPGSTHSSVPNYTSRTLSSGTSMSSPYVAGSVALLLSGLYEYDQPGLLRHEYPQHVVKAAIRTSATAMPGYTELDCGAGLLNVPSAFARLCAYQKSGFNKSLVNYKLETTCFNLGTDVECPASYWRAAVLPDENTPRIFNVSAAFPDSISLEARSDFFRIYDLRATEPWLKPFQKTIFLKGDKPSSVSLLYDKKRLQKPGLYVGKVVATRTNKRLAKSKRKVKDEVEFELLNTVIVPYTFSLKDNYQVLLKKQRLNSGEIGRYFFAVPNGCSSFRVRLISENQEPINLSASISNHEGFVVGYVPPMAENELATEENITGDELEPGIYEVTVDADRFGRPKTISYTLQATIDLVDMKEEFQLPNKLQFKIVNSGSRNIYGTFNSSVDGYERTWSDSVFARQVYRKPIKFYENDRAINLEIRVTPEDYNKNTDVALIVVDSSGRKVAFKTLEHTTESLFIFNPYKKGVESTVFLEIDYGFALDDKEDFVVFLAKEFHHIPVNLLDCVPGATHLIPSQPQTIEVSVPELPAVPEGFRPRGFIRFEEATSGILHLQRYFYFDK